jgi:hypothetical protein
MALHHQALEAARAALSRNSGRINKSPERVALELLLDAAEIQAAMIDELALKAGVESPKPKAAKTKAKAKRPAKPEAPTSEQAATE